MTARFRNIARRRLWKLPLVLAIVGVLAFATAFTPYGVETTQGAELAFNPWWWHPLEPHFHPPSNPYEYYHYWYPYLYPYYYPYYQPYIA